LEFLRIFQELNNLLELFLCFIGTGNVLKGGFFSAGRKEDGRGICRS